MCFACYLFPAFVCNFAAQINWLRFCWDRAACFRLFHSSYLQALEANDINMPKHFPTQLLHKLHPRQVDLIISAFSSCQIEPLRGENARPLFRGAGGQEGCSSVVEHEATKTCENLAKIVPRPSKIEAQGLQNRAWSLPRCNFSKTVSLRRFQRSHIKIFRGQESQLGSILELQNPPKSRPRREKIDVKKRRIFDIDF